MALTPGTYYIITAYPFNDAYLAAGLPSASGQALIAAASLPSDQFQVGVSADGYNTITIGGLNTADYDTYVFATTSLPPQDWVIQAFGDGPGYTISTPGEGGLGWSIPSEPSLSGSPIALVPLHDPPGDVDTFTWSFDLID